MSRTKSRPRLHVLSLEARDVPTLFGIDLGDIAVDVGGVVSPGDPPPASITFDGGVVTATGTDDADVIRFDLVTPTVALFRLTPDVTSGALQDRVRVAITDAAGNVRPDAAGNPLVQFFNADQVIRLDARGQGGNDTIVNTTAKTMDAAGGFGNDSLQGGGGLDFLRGDAGDDSLAGGAGDDALDGGDGNDLLRGEAGNDLLEGGAGNDTHLGGAGNDAALGGDGADQFGGGDGDDTLNGGAGPDILLGENGNDLIRGDDGNDVLSGGAGNDSLYGGAGNDSLEGHAGNDGLFGGDGKDWLSGGAGIDRFLRWVRSGNQTTLVDKAANESLTTFKGTPSGAVDVEPGPDLRYFPGEWTEGEIEALDAGLGWLHAETGNTRLLRLKSGGNMTFLRYGTYRPYDTTDGVNDAAEKQANELGAFIAGANHGNGTIDVRQLGLLDPREAMRLAIHELAHNWQGAANPKWAQWLSLSGWVQSNTPTADQELSKDGKWVYARTAAFARDYGKTNPYEDFATAFEAYFLLKTGALPNFEPLIPKLNFIGLFVTALV